MAKRESGWIHERMIKVMERYERIPQWRKDMDDKDLDWS